jgi:hypothetical protein
LEIGQVFGQVSDLVVGTAEVLHFSMESLVSFLSNGEIDHGHEGFSGEEGVHLLARKDSSRVGVFPRPKGMRVTRAIASSRQEKFRVVGEEVVSVEGGINRSPSQPWDGIVMLWCHPFDVSMPVISGYDPEFLHDFGSRRAWAVVEVWER